MTEQSLYYLESFIPSWLVRDASYIEAYRDRIQALMEMQDYEVDEITMPSVIETPNCPTVPGMCVLRVEALVREYDIEVPMDEDADEEAVDDGEPLSAVPLPSDAAQVMARQLTQRMVERSGQEG